MTSFIIIIQEFSLDYLFIFGVFLFSSTLQTTQPLSLNLSR